MMLRTNVRVFTKYWKKKKTNFRKYLKKHHLHVHILKLVQRPDFQRGKVVDLIGIDRANSGFRLEWKARRWNRISRGRPSRNTIHFESWGHDAIMHKCLCIYASEKTRIGSTGARRHGFSDPPLPPSKIAKAKNDPREANKLWSEKFSWIGEREREGWYKEEYGVRRWRGANEFSMPFPISMIGVYWRAFDVWEFSPDSIICLSLDFHRRACPSIVSTLFFLLIITFFLPYRCRWSCGKGGREGDWKKNW